VPVALANASDESLHLLVVLHRAGVADPIDPGVVGVQFHHQPVALGIAMPSGELPELYVLDCGHFTFLPGLHGEAERETEGCASRRCPFDPVTMSGARQNGAEQPRHSRPEASTHGPHVIENRLCGEDALPTEYRPAGKRSASRPKGTLPPNLGHSTEYTVRHPVKNLLPCIVRL